MNEKKHWTRSSKLKLIISKMYDHTYLIFHDFRYSFSCVNNEKNNLNFKEIIFSGFSWLSTFGVASEVNKNSFTASFATYNKNLNINRKFEVCSKSKLFHHFKYMVCNILLWVLIQFFLNLINFDWLDHEEYYCIFISHLLQATGYLK